MKLRKVARWTSGVLAGLAALVVLAYLLRWPLLEGRIRREIARLAEEHLQADVAVPRLGGNLLSSIRLEGVEVRPRPGSPIRAARAGSIEVRFGFLGRGPVEIDVSGAEVALAPKPGPSSVARTVRDVFPVLRLIRFPGKVRARDVRVELADGRRFEADEATLEGENWSARFRTEGFGEVQASARGGEKGAIALDARASEGPVRSAKVVLGPLEGRAQSLRIESATSGHAILWEGRVIDDAEGRAERAEGKLVLPQGRADAEIDLVAERCRLDVDGTIAVETPVRADVDLKLLAEGPLEGPLESWRFSSVSAKSRNLVYKTLKIDYAEATCPSGTLAGLLMRAGVSAGQDHAEAEGTVRWKNGALEFELTGGAEASNVAPYLALLPKAPPLKAESVRGQGKVAFAGGRVTVDGTIQSGPGSFDAGSWRSLRVSGSFSPEKSEAREIVASDVLVGGKMVAPVVTGKGSLEGERIEATLEGGPDHLRISARYPASGDVEGEFALAGPCLWLRTFDIQLPEWISPVSLAVTASRSGGTLRTKGTLRGGKELAASLDVTAVERDGVWTLDVAPGTIDLPGRRRLAHERFSIEARAGLLRLPDLKAALQEPAIGARISGTVEWTAEKTSVEFDARDLVAWGIQLEALRGRAGVDRAAGETRIELSWGREDGPSFNASGRLGRENDFHVVVRAPDLRDPFLRKLMKDLPLEGNAVANLHVTGRLDRPDVTGTISLRGVTAGKIQPLNLAVELRTEDGRALLIEASESIPYGVLTVEGRVGLPWIETKARLDLRATLETDELKPFLLHLDPVARKWIPTGQLWVEAFARGPVESLSDVVWGLTANFESPQFQPPEPLGKATDLRVAARLDESGLVFESVEGRLGDGPFQGKGLWELWKEGRPMALHVTGDDLLVVDDPLARLRIKPDATLRYTTSRGLWLDGYVEVPFALYHRDTGSPALGTGGRRAAPAPLESMVPRLRLIPLPVGGFRIPGIAGLEDLALDVRFRTTGEFRIENSLVGLLIGAEGKVRGTAAEPALSGWVRAKPRHGEIRLGPGAFLHVDSAEVVLPAEPGKEANVRFEGHLGAGQDQITILVVGPPDRASLTLQSSPPKTQKELLAIIGQKVALGTLTGQLTPGQADEWPVADRKESFFERIFPTVLPGEAPGQKREPWELPAEGTGRGTVVRTEYALNRWFSIVAETDRHADISGDLKLRIRF